MVQVFATRPTFRDYLRVIRRQPAFGLKLVAAGCFGASASIREGPLVLAAICGGVAVFVVMWFPIWRHFAPRYPRWFTFGRPENLRGRDTDWS